MRIISTVPSLTELLYDLGLEENIVGITKFCIHPDSIYLSKTRIGGTKNLNLDKIKSLKPDLIISNKEENTKEQIELLQNEYDLILSDIQNKEDSINFIRELGIKCNRIPKANELIIKLSNIYDNLKSSNKIKSLYLIWNKPIMSVGRDTYIHSMMKLLGLENVMATHTRYPVVSNETIKELKPELILLSSEPYPYTKSHALEFQKHFPESKCILVNGELFSWYGSRLIHLENEVSKLKLHLSI